MSWIRPICLFRKGVLGGNLGLLTGLSTILWKQCGDARIVPPPPITPPPRPGQALIAVHRIGSRAALWCG